MIATSNHFLGHVAQNWPPQENNLLYRAQTSSEQVFQTSWFPCYSQAYVQSQEGLKGLVISSYSIVYDGVSAIGSIGSAVFYAVIDTVQKVAFAIIWVGDLALGFVVRPLGQACYNWVGVYLERAFNSVFPINPINGHRHFVAIPRSVEKFLGDYIFYPLITLGMMETSEMLPGKAETIAHRVDSVMRNLTLANQALLNPPDESTHFDYRVKTIASSDLNAFAVPAGGMVVFSQLVKELQGSIETGLIQQAQIKLADGSEVTVDLRHVTLDDVLASLMGHEMTHAASRHSIVALFAKFIRSIFFQISSFFLVESLKNQDTELQDLQRKPESELKDSERQTLQAKKIYYANLYSFFDWIQEKVNDLFGLFYSKKNEYEADVTGAYFASQAGYNPLGSIYLQELLSRKHNVISDFFHKHLEFLFTHPHADNRKLALLAAIGEFAPERLKGRLTNWNIASGYDLDRSSPGIQYQRYLLTKA